MAKVFCIDVGRCSGCYNCQFACKDEHCGNEWMPYAKEQPLTGQFWLQIEEHIQGSRPKLRMYYTPLLCGHCKEAPCIAAAKGGAVCRREDGLVIIDPEKAAGQRQIAPACPYGRIFWNEKLNIPQKCTGCAHLLEEGLLPRCVDVCRTGALRFGEEEDFKDFIKDAVTINPETGAHPRVYYKNIPGQFIAGTVYDPVKEEVIKNAECVLSRGPEKFVVFSDIFGDFWFEKLKKDLYSLKIKAQGYEPLLFEELDTSGQCINLGDLPMKAVTNAKTFSACCKTYRAGRNK